MELRELVTVDAAFDPRFAALEIRGISADSRRVRPGDAFVAVPGTNTDGLRFATAAVAAGAVAIVAEQLPPNVPEPVAFIRVADARRALALMAAKLFPGQPTTIAAITGTSGKTSVAHFTRQIWTRLGHPAASIGTVGISSPSGETYGSLTTPDPVELHRTLDRLAAEGVTHLAIEASSHGLDQRRLDGMRVHLAAFTNLTRDHLDYHGTPEQYLAAKLRLFEELLGEGGTAVINIDGEHADDVCQAASARGHAVMRVGRNGDGIQLIGATIDGFAQRIHAVHDGTHYDIRLSLVGHFQVENALLASGLAIASGGEAGAVFAALETLKGAKGRLESVGQYRDAPIFIDYAHKPDALAKALEALRPYVRHHLIVVFGAGGDRDRGKRALMGSIAASNADTVIVTDDNPRSEDPAVIRKAILSAAPGATEIANRGEAIRHAVGSLQAGDVLLVAGKGHESGQIIGDRVLPFSDHAAVAIALEELR